MHRASLDVSHVLMVADPKAPHWHDACALALHLAAEGVRTTLACVREPSLSARACARMIPGLEVRVEGAASAGVLAPQEWLLFLEMLVQPDLIQLFLPEHTHLPWRSPTILSLDEPSVRRAISDEAQLSKPNLVIVTTEDARRKLEGTPEQPALDCIGSGPDMGRNYLLAYQEMLQSVSLDQGAYLQDKFELI